MFEPVGHQLLSSRCEQCYCRQNVTQQSIFVQLVLCGQFGEQEP